MLDRTDVLFDWTDQADPTRAALIMVDLQNDFVHADGWVAKQQVPGFMGDTGIEAVLDQSQALLDAARAAGVMTVFVRMLGDDKYLSPALYAQYRRNHGHERPPCVQESTWGADFYGDLRPDGRPKEFVLEKHRYSAFIGTRLDQLLRSNGVQTIVVCGVATTGCVESTIRDGFMHDYYVVIARDACGDYETARHTSALSKLDLSFGTVVSVADVAQLWGSKPTRNGAGSEARAASPRAGN